jgi:hypothetical protein
MIEYTVTVKDDRIEWRLNGKLHREDGPAIEWKSKRDLKYVWYLNGKIHREDGPACEFHSDKKEWWLDSVELTEEEFIKKTQPVKEMTFEEIQKELGYKIKIIEENPFSTLNNRTHSNLYNQVNHCLETNPDRLIVETAIFTDNYKLKKDHDCRVFNANMVFLYVKDANGWIMIKNRYNGNNNQTNIVDKEVIEILKKLLRE